METMNRHGILVRMLKERKVWRILRALEREAGRSPISRTILAQSVLEKNRGAIPFLRFKDEQDVMRTFQSLVGLNHARHEDYSSERATGPGSTVVAGVKSDPRADSFYSGSRFWNKWLEEVGFWKIVGFLLAASSFVPNTYTNDLVLWIIDRVKEGL